MAPITLAALEGKRWQPAFHGGRQLSTAPFHRPLSPPLHRLSPPLRPLPLSHRPFSPWRPSPQLLLGCAFTRRNHPTAQIVLFGEHNKWPQSPRDARYGRNRIEWPRSPRMSIAITSGPAFNMAANTDCPQAFNMAAIASGGDWCSPPPPLHRAGARAGVLGRDPQRPGRGERPRRGKGVGGGFSPLKSSFFSWTAEERAQKLLLGPGNTVLVLYNTAFAAVRGRRGRGGAGAFSLPAEEEAGAALVLGKTLPVFL